MTLLDNELPVIARMVVDAMARIEPKERRDFMAVVKDAMQAYCPKCGEAFAEGCVCTR